MNWSVTNDSGNNDNDNAKKDTSIAETMEIENVTASFTAAALTENQNNQELLQTLVQNDVPNHVSNKIDTLTVRNNQNKNTLVTRTVTLTV